MEKRQAIRILELLIQELGINLKLIRETIRPNLEKLKIPYAPLELAIWEAVSPRIDVIKDDKTLAAIARAYYQFDTLEKAIATLVEHEGASFLPVKEPAKTELKKRVLNDIQVILDHIREPRDKQDRTTIAIADEAISEANKEKDRLKDC